MKKITLADIAKKTGYSVNTVSHALRDMKDISKEVKNYINDTATAMGYIPNISAGVLRGGKTKSIAIIVSDISNPYYSIIIKEMEKRLCKCGYSAFIMNTDEDEAAERKAITSAIGRNVDGIIICPVQKSDSNIDFLEENNVPCILLGRSGKKKNSGYIICDEEEAGFYAAEHLIKLGHNKILFLNEPDFISGAKDRLSGIEKAFEKHSLPKGSLHTEKINLADRDESIEKALLKNTDCSGIICFDDMAAMKVCRILKLQGKNVPEDNSVVGFGNISSRYDFPMMLTSVGASKTKMAIEAVDALINVIDGKEAPQIILPVALTVGETSAEVSRKYRTSKRELSDYLL